MGFWKVPYAGMTNPVGSRIDEALFEQPPKGVWMVQQAKSPFFIFTLFIAFFVLYGI